MTFRVYKEKPPNKKNFYLRLEKRLLGNGIALAATDKSGSPIGGYLLAITDDGYLHLFHHINPDIGLQLSNEDRLKIEEDE